MAFIKRDVKDRVVQYPRRYQFVEVQPDIFDLIPVTGTVIEEGTPVNKELLQRYEDGISDLDTDISEHLADIVTQAEPNKILRLDENAKLPTSITGDALTVGGKSPDDLIDGAWEKIAEVTLASAITQVDFTDISNEYKTLKLIFHVGSAGTTAANLNLRFNDDSGDNYRRQHILANSNSLSSQGVLSGDALLLLNSLPSNTAALAFGEVNISNLEALKEKQVLGEWYSERVSSPTIADLRLVLLGGVWANKTDKINKISVLASTNQIKAGSRFVLWGVNNSR